MQTRADDLDLTRLPPEFRAAFEAQQARIAALSEEKVTLAEQNAELATHNARLEHLVREFRQALYGKRSEKLDTDARQLAFEDMEGAVAEVEEARAGPPPIPGQRLGARRQSVSWVICRQICRAWNGSSSRRVHPAPAAVAIWCASARIAPKGSISCRRRSG